MLVCVEEGVEKRKGAAVRRFWKLWCITLAWADLASLVGVLLGLPLGLIIPELMAYGAAFIAGAALAAVAAAWSMAWVSPDHRPPRALAVAAATGLAAILLEAGTAGYLAYAESQLPRVIALPPIMWGAIAAVVLSLVATVAAWRGHPSRRGTGYEVRVTIALVALAVAVIPGAVGVAALLGVAGA